ncbi:MAG: STM3941 family protein [Flectobacillus sp.]|uniref:STM3941 family protein n=1 Tax=Flectobacillus sp. TaxID=50419 RepID=UPI003B9C196A
MYKQVDTVELSVFVLGIIFFGVGVVQALIKLLSKSTEVSISEEGIYDQRWAINSRIPWNEIKSSEIISVFRQKFIRIKLNKPQKANKDSFLSRFTKKEISELYIFVSDSSVNDTNLNHFVNQMARCDKPEQEKLMRNFGAIE